MSMLTVYVAVECSTQLARQSENPALEGRRQHSNNTHTQTHTRTFKAHVEEESSANQIEMSQHRT